MGIGMKIMMNAGNPESAFTFGQFPNEGIGLARLEFVINNTIGVHPKALLDYDNMSAEVKAAIDERMLGYATPQDFYINKMPRALPRSPPPCTLSASSAVSPTSSPTSTRAS